MSAYYPPPCLLGGPAHPLTQIFLAHGFCMIAAPQPCQAPAMNYGLLFLYPSSGLAGMNINYPSLKSRRSLSAVTDFGAPAARLEACGEARQAARCQIRLAGKGQL